MARDLNAPVTHWLVIWKLLPDETQDRLSNCVLQAGYTSFDDIPKMLAIRAGVHVDQIQIHTIARNNEI